MIIYLASPYTHPDPAVEVERFESVCAAAARLLSWGNHIYSPIAHNHPMRKHSDLPGTWDFWQDYDRDFIAKCGELWVLCLEGWRESRGITAEIEIAKDLGLPVKYLSPTHLGAFSEEPAA